jgi:formate dehydrogenase subunit gamma
MRRIEHPVGEHVLVRRYSGTARINHWITAITFVALGLSGLALFHPDLYGLSVLFGGGATMRWLHPWLGVVLAASFFMLFLRFVPANLPEGTDIVWLARMRDVLAGHEEYLPEVGKYNAGQKVVFWAMAILIPVMLVTGIGLWEPARHWVEGVIGFHATIDQQRWAAVLHATAAVLAILVWVVHVYAGIWVRGTISAMTAGMVTGGWAWRHHRKWLREEVTKDTETT